MRTAEVQSLAANDLLSDSSLSAIPGLADRELLAHAIAMRCDVFCTRDSAAIICKRHLLPALPIRIMSPGEWWVAIRPESHSRVSCGEIPIWQSAGVQGVYVVHPLGSS